MNCFRSNAEKLREEKKKAIAEIEKYADDYVKLSSLYDEKTKLENTVNNLYEEWIDLNF